MINARKWYEMQGIRCYCQITFSILFRFWPKSTTKYTGKGLGSNIIVILCQCDIFVSLSRSWHVIRSFEAWALIYCNCILHQIQKQIILCTTCETSSGTRWKFSRFSSDSHAYIQYSLKWNLKTAFASSDGKRSSG